VSVTLEGMSVPFMLCGKDLNEAQTVATNSGSSEAMVSLMESAFGRI
jgi:hypothetical protein